MINKYIDKFIQYISIVLQLHSKAPTEEIKRNWEIFALVALPVTVLVLTSGDKILGFIPTPKIQFMQDYGVWIFFIFTICFCIAFFNIKKCKEITLKIQERQKSGKP